MHRLKIFPRSSSPLLRPATLDRCIGVVGSNDVVLNLVSLSGNSAWIYDWLRERRVRYMIMSRGGLPFSFGASGLLWGRRIGYVTG